VAGRLSCTSSLSAYTLCHKIASAAPHCRVVMFIFTVVTPGPWLAARETGEILPRLLSGRCDFAVPLQWRPVFIDSFC